MVAAILLSGCASASRHAQRANLLAVCELGLAQVESGRGRLILVAGPHVPEEVASALSTFRTVIPPEQIPASDQYVIPQGYFVMQQVSIRGAQASFVGTAGPHFKHHDLSCGYTYDINLVRGADGVWRISQPITISMC